ncbi:chloramphenicol acetyltransferase [uncultured Aliiroseovarius sp.]|uniref:chloramphenicol acetyltransferase n=1 Tax=uncultured Aliiroseovarius sp. TaxID=1658783 RepID=UPI002601E44F|nr:chloramphenicol acetyltransferase [uncultured Aliiroseovarius sp.]
MPKLSPDDPVLHPDCEIHNSTFGRYVEIGRGTRLVNAQLGDYSYCDRHADIANAQIGKFANIAAMTRIGATDHPLETASCHHFLYRSEYYWDDVTADEDFFARRAARVAHIGHDTWIGHGAMVKPEVTLGHGAVVASGAIVTKDVAPYTIVAGVPAAPIRARQPKQVAERLIELAWWDWDHARLRASLEDFRSLSAEAFLEKYA